MEAPALQPVTGATLEGVPLSFNRKPDERLRPWVSRSMVAVATQAGHETLEGLLCNDAAYLRCAVGSDWVAHTAEGPLDIRDQTFLCGQHTRSMPMQFSGGIKVVGLMLRPGALWARMARTSCAASWQICARSWSVKAAVSTSFVKSGSASA